MRDGILNRVLPLGSVFIVLLTLKLTEVSAVADWSWWWVSSPLFILVDLLTGRAT